MPQEFDRVPMFMKKAPEEIDPEKYPELACLQAIVHDEDRPPEGMRPGAQNKVIRKAVFGIIILIITPQRKQKV